MLKDGVSDDEISAVAKNVEESGSSDCYFMSCSYIFEKYLQEDTLDKN